MKGGQISEGERIHERLWNLGNKQRVLEGRTVWGWVSPVMAIKEGMYYMEHWMCYTKTMNHVTVHQKLMVQK